MMRETETDSHVSGCLIGRDAGYQREFYVEPYDDSDQAKERADLIENMISDLDTRSLFKAVIEARKYIYSVIDFEWEIKNSLDHITGFKRFDQKFFKYNDAERLVIDWGKEGKPIPDSALVCETSDNPIMLPVLRDFILKEFGMESWASFLETFGEGIIIGKYPPGSDPKFKDEVNKAVQAIARSSRGSMPDGANIEIKETTRNTGDHDKFVQMCDTGISISILGHENAVSQGSGMQVGENMNSFKVRGEIAVDDLYFLDAQINRIIQIFAKRNWPDDKRPRFGTDKSERVDVGKWIQVLKTAYNHGIKINPDEYRKLGLDIYDDQEPIIRKPQMFEYGD